MSKPQLKPLKDQAIVITGATSGVGLTTARRAARAGACVFLIARGEQDLKTLCEDIQAEGGRVAWAAADVADYDALAEAADKCRRLFGGFDTWVNNAGVSIFGPIRETTLEDQRRLFETNYWGVVNSSLIAVEHLRGRPGGGAIVNVGSILSDAPIPLQGIYAASKHAVKGFTNSLRMELIREKAPVSLSLVKPAAIDTPYNRHARNLTGQAVQNPQPVYGTHVVADTVLYCASHPIREITVGGGGRLIASFYSALPGVAEPLFARFAPSMMRDKSHDYHPWDDGLYDPTNDGLADELHYPVVRRFSTLAEVRKHPGIAGAVVALLVAVGVGYVLLNQKSGPTRFERWKTQANPRRWRMPAMPSMPDMPWLARLRSDGMDGRLEALQSELDRYGGRARRGLEDAGGRARRYASDAGHYARDHAKEGGAVAATVALLGVLAAVALKARQNDD
ncbi:MAG: SDR family oxidoreductase [Brevundimonas sp.]|uniref:SDR family oxidoreductase n=1 Tax=Brevundimonas sp. TaxID=1871086 RepID=UPI003001F45C